MSDLDDFKSTYFDECSELLLELEEQFRAISEGDRSGARLTAVIRAIRSIRGGAGALGLSGLVGFAHAYETLLDEVREGRVEMSPPVMRLCIRANDIVADFVAAARVGQTLPAGYGAGGKAEFDALCADPAVGWNTPPEDSDMDFVPVAVALSGTDTFEVPPMVAEEGSWRIRFAPRPELYARANDPLLLLRELASLGPTEVRATVDDIPPLAGFDPFGVYCRWEILLTAPAVDEARIAEVFEFVDGTCELSISPADDSVPVPLPRMVDARALDRLDDMPGFAELIGDLEPAGVRRAVEPQPDTAQERPSAGEERRNGPQSIRVDLDKVERVVNMVGEQVIIQSMLSQQMDETLRARYQELVRGLGATPLSNTRDFVRGVINLRGSFVPVFDLRARFGDGQTNPTKTHVVVVM